MTPASEQFTARVRSRNRSAVRNRLLRLLILLLGITGALTMSYWLRP